MKQVKETVYECDFCGRLSKSKRGTKWHEKKCKKNPNNQHSCFFCEYLEVVEPEPYGGDGYEFTCLNPKCKFYQRELYTYKKDGAFGYKHATRMPTNCSHFKDRTLNYLH